ncbi:MAG: acyl-CoA thioesterase [Candidatus Sericytochromatia bacterium]
MGVNQDDPIYRQRVEQALTRVVKIVFPNVTNHYDTLFGGTALQWMDEVASIASIRFTRQQTVTVALDEISFNKAIPSGSFVELVAQVVEVGTTSMKVQVDVFLERMDRDGREQAISGMFTFVAINSERRPVPIEWHKPLLTD